jgi:hypothetical protein
MTKTITMTERPAVLVAVLVAVLLAVVAFLVVAPKVTITERAGRGAGSDTNSGSLGLTESQRIYKDMDGRNEKGLFLYLKIEFRKLPQQQHPHTIGKVSLFCTQISCTLCFIYRSIPTRQADSGDTL